MTTGTLPVIVVCSTASSTTMDVLMSATSIGLAAALGQHYEVLLPSLIPRDTVRGIVGLATAVQQQPQSQMPH